MIFRLALMVVAAVALMGVIDSTPAGSKRPAAAHRDGTSPLQGGQIDETKVALEAAVKADPADVDARVTLLGYYMRKQFADAASRAHVKGISSG